ncbi:MAG: NAD(P)-dependent oxidoreductase [Sandaracinaceae bacterium]
MRLPIHVFHRHASDRLGQLVREAAPDREVLVLSEEDALRAALPDIEVLFAPMPPRTGWAPAARLRLLQLAGVGADHLLPSPDLPREVEVATLRGLFANDVAEHITMMALALVRGLPLAIEAARRREFQSRPVPRLAGRRVVFLGAGAIGRAAAVRLAVLGVRCESVSRLGRADDAFARSWSSDRLLEALRDADGLVVAVPLTEATRGIVSPASLAALTPGAFLIDVSRGGVVDETGLLQALAEERIVAARDVFENEPLPPSSPFFEEPGCLVTPHIAGYATGYLDGAVSVLLDNVARLERGTPRQRLVDRVSNY